MSDLKGVWGPLASPSTCPVYRGPWPSAPTYKQVSWPQAARGCQPATSEQHNGLCVLLGGPGRLIVTSRTTSKETVVLSIDHWRQAQNSIGANDV